MSKMTEGYLCPECLLKLDSEAFLLAHFEINHGDGRQTYDVSKCGQDDNHLVLEQSDDEENPRVTLLEGVISALIAGTLTPESIPDISQKPKLASFLKEQASLQAKNEALISRLTTERESLRKNQSAQSHELSAKIKELIEVKQQVKDLQGEVKEAQGQIRILSQQALLRNQTDGQISSDLDNVELKEATEELIIVREKNDFLQVELENSKTALNELKEKNKSLTEKASSLALQVQVQEDRHGEMSNTLEVVRRDEKILRASLVESEEAIIQKNAEIEFLKTELQQRVMEVEVKSSECSRLERRLNETILEKGSLTDKNVMLNAELDETKTRLICSIESENALKRQLAEADDTIASQSVQVEKHDSVVADLRSKMQAEHEALMDQVIDGHNKSEQLKTALQTSHNELEGVQRIVLDLGRQNLALQIIQERLSNRQWVSDGSVRFCFNCQKEFTTSVRKHHCRYCGKVFCQACSSRKTATPASKDPLRVCDACFAELTGVL